MGFVLSILTGGLTFLKRLPWQFFAALGALLGIWLLWHLHTSSVSRARSDGFADGRKDATATFVAAQAEAQAADIARAQEVKARDDKINREKSVALENQLASARAAVADYARRMQRSSAAHSGSIRRADMPSSAEPASAAYDAGRETIVSINDLNLCADAVTKAESWRDWWITEASHER